MPCYHPLPAWYSKRVNPSGRRGIVFNLADGFKDMPIQVPCGTCIGCRKVRERQWTLRCLHESKMHLLSWFVTLTYDDEHLPVNGSLSKRDWQLFMKRFREAYGSVRFFMCGQYGERSLRAHYHALLFGVEFDDKRRYSGDGARALYVSAKLDRLWALGACKIGSLSLASVRYVTAYMSRSCLDKAECERRGIEPEFQLMSRRPGIGRTWLDKYSGDVYPEDSVTLRGGVKFRPPRYYDTVMEKVNSELMWRLRVQRKKKSMENPDNSGKRLMVREEVAEGKVQLFSGSDPD